jgi:hypothetical protein
MVAEGEGVRRVSPVLPHFYCGSSAGEVRMVYARAGAQSEYQNGRLVSAERRRARTMIAVIVEKR